MNYYSARMAAGTPAARILAFCLSAAIILLSAPGPSASAARTKSASAQPGRKEPIRINSNRMVADNKKNIITFIGKVSAVQGNMEIKSDRLEVYVKKQAKDSNKKNDKPSAPKNAGAAQAEQGSVERLVAIGNVLITQGKQKFAAGERLDYNERTGVAVLTGNPRAWEDSNQVVGTKIEIFLRDGRTVVHGSRRRRVSVTLFPEGGKGPGRTQRGR